MWPCAKEVSVCTRALELPFYDVNAVALDRDRTTYLYTASPRARPIASPYTTGRTDPPRHRSIRRKYLYVPALTPHMSQRGTFFA